MIKMTIEATPEQAIEIAKILGTPKATPTQTRPTAQQIVAPHATVSTQQIPVASPSDTTVSGIQQIPISSPTIAPVQQTTPPTAVRKYTQDELALAARPVCEAGRQAELLNLLHSFTYTDGAGNVQPVQSIQQLPEALYPEFANGIRALGGRI